MDIVNNRGTLEYTKAAMLQGELKIGFIGGSITAFENYRSWTEPVINWFISKYDDVKISAVNAGIGATKSDFAVFRAEQELENCDLVFIEYAVNDFSERTEYRMKTREGLIRKLLKEQRDLVFVYTFGQEMYDDMIKNIVPKSISEFEELAEYYNISSVWMGREALDQNINGLLRWEEWLPDGTHPQERGSYTYAGAVIKYLESEMESQRTSNIHKQLPAMYADNWENAAMLDFEKINWKKPWSLRKNSINTGHTNPGTFLYTSAVGAELEFTFVGKGLFMVQMFGKLAAEFDYQIDDGEIIHCEPINNRYDWMGEKDWYRAIVLADDLDNKEHIFRMKTRHSTAPQFCGTRMCIKMFGVIK